MVTKEFVKEYLQIESDEYESMIDHLIPIAQESYKIIRNKDWDVDEEGQTVYPVNLNVVVAEMVAWKLFQSNPGSPVISSSRIGEITTSFQNEPLHYGWPRPIVKQITRYIKGGI